MSGQRRIEKLRRDHNVNDFDCGQDQLNTWLKRYALQNESAGSTRTYLGLEGDKVIGFYSLAVGQAEYGEAPARIKKGLARHPVPVMLLARLAVDKDFQKLGVGKALLRDAVLRTTNAADFAGIRALEVHAKDEKARKYYEQFDFEPSPTDPLHLFVLLKDIRHSLGM